jgi:phospholipid transport system transporter-binding protein
MMRREGESLILDGAVTLATAAGLLAQSEAHFAEGVAEVDFGAVTETDSAALALALEWARRVAAGGRTLRIANIPESMKNMARLYAVTELLSLSPS